MQKPCQILLRTLLIDLFFLILRIWWESDCWGCGPLINRLHYFRLAWDFQRATQVEEPWQILFSALLINWEFKVLVNFLWGIWRRVFFGILEPMRDPLPSRLALGTLINILLYLNVTHGLIRVWEEAISPILISGSKQSSLTVSVWHSGTIPTW